MKITQTNKIEIELTEQKVIKQTLKCANCDCDILEEDFKAELDSKNSNEWLCEVCYDKLRDEIPFSIEAERQEDFCN